MIDSFQQMRETSPAFCHALLQSEEKRIVGVIAFVSFFTALAAVRIFMLGSAMSRWGLVAAVLVIAFELGLFRAVNQCLQAGEDLANSAWYVSSILECLFPAVGVAFLVSNRLMSDYRPLATPWVLAFFPFILLSVLRLSPKQCCRLRGRLKFRISDGSLRGRLEPKTRTRRIHSDPNRCGVLRACACNHGRPGCWRGGRTHVEAALSEAETRHQFQEVEHELQIARSIQQSLLPKSRPQIAGFQIAGWSRTADDTGGDFYDWKRLPDGRWIVVLADVTGHGIGPAILASVCRAYSRASFNVRDRLETMLKNINESFAEDLTPERFATFVAAMCNDRSDQVELLSAGHGPIFVYSSDNQSLRLLDAQGLPLGILPDLRDAVPVKLCMKPGDIVLLITHGFFEWENGAGEPFGSERLAAAVGQFSDRQPEVIIAELYEAVQKFAQGSPQQDDLTAVLIKRSADVR